MSVRKAHNSGRNHLRNVVDYYEQIGHDKAQSVIDSITSSYAAEGQVNPMLQNNGMGSGGFGPPPPFGFPGRPGQIPPPFGMPGAPGPMGGNRGGMPLPFPPPGGFPAMPGQPPFPFPPPGGFTAAAASPNNAMPFPPPGGLPPPSQAMGFLPFGGPSPSPGPGVSVPPGMGGPMGR